MPSDEIRNTNPLMGTLLPGLVTVTTSEEVIVVPLVPGVIVKAVDSNVHVLVRSKPFLVRRRRESGGPTDATRTASSEPQPLAYVPERRPGWACVDVTGVIWLTSTTGDV